MLKADNREDTPCESAAKAVLKGKFIALEPFIRN